MAVWYLRLPRLTDAPERHAILGNSLVVEEDYEADESDNAFFEGDSDSDYDDDNRRQPHALLREEIDDEYFYNPETREASTDTESLICPSYREYLDSLDNYGLLLAFGLVLCTVSFTLGKSVGSKAIAN
jgi:hypothetical protein